MLSKETQKALFLDRDGIINIDHGYVYKKENFEFTPGIFALVRLFVSRGYHIFVLTNQSGIARGYYTKEDFLLLSDWMLTRFEQEGIPIQKVSYCPHLPTEGCLCRKPQIGMIEEILQTYPLSLEQSYFIGDKQSDMDLARNAEIGQSIAIAKTPLSHASYHFETILACKEYLEENQDKIQ